MSHKHPFHLVDPSPWPIIVSINLFLLIIEVAIYLHELLNNKIIILIPIIGLFCSVYYWFRDIVRESTFEGQHTSLVQNGLRLGIILFIISEIIFFFGFFWSFFWSCVNPYPELGAVWPPYGITPIETWKIPFLNTLILLLSGSSVTWAHHAILSGKSSNVVKKAIQCTILLAVLFTSLQGLEYMSASFSIRDGLYGSNFYILTGFHGFHVFIGTVILSISLIRIYFNQFTRQHHFGFEASAWYWHFVDVVWLFLFIFLYWWSN